MKWDIALERLRDQETEIIQLRKREIFCAAEIARLKADKADLLEALERINSDWLTSSGHSSQVTRHMTRALIARAKGEA